jgi:hypothetical protein
MARYNHEVVKAQACRRPPFGQRLYDAAKKKWGIIIIRRGVEVKGAEVEQEGEGEEGGEEQGAQVGQACGGAEELGEGTGRVVVEIVEDSASASWVERDWCGKHDWILESGSSLLYCTPPSCPSWCRRPTWMSFVRVQTLTREVRA